MIAIVEGERGERVKIMFLISSVKYKFINENIMRVIVLYLNISCHSNEI